jgi:hypothetical protein
MTANKFPSIWLGDFHSKAEYDKNASRLSAMFSIYDWIDDRLLFSRHPFSYPAYCVACDRVTKIQIDWTFRGVNASGSVNPAWTETAVCEECGLNSRMRALVDFLKTHCDLNTIRRAYIAEQITPAFGKLKSLLPALVGSEYFGPKHQSGQLVKHRLFFPRVRHEDITALSFGDTEFDLAITQDIFEHVPHY